MGIIIFTLFVYFVITEKPLLYSAHFAVAMLNRESAFYIGLWMGGIAVMSLMRTAALQSPSPDRLAIVNCRTGVHRIGVDMYSFFALAHLGPGSGATPIGVELQGQVTFSMVQQS